MLIEFHMLKNYPPVNLNRDDTGAPKSCFFGGVQRGRISSQCLKRSWRTSEVFRELDSYGIRTRGMPELVMDELAQMGVDKELVEAAGLKLTGIANKDGTINKKGMRTTQIVFYTNDEIHNVAARVKETIDSLKGDKLKQFAAITPKDFTLLKKDATRNAVTLDIALFGRMVTSDYFADVEAAMQVAHAISTHAVNRESDYFAAVDDLLEARDEQGAGMIGDTDFNSCCYYEYAALDADLLRRNLENAPNRDDILEKLIPVLLRAMAFTNPSGKQNTFAGQVLPDAIVVECKREKIPLSYANAFEEAVPTWGAKPQIAKNSIIKLCAEIDLMDGAYALPVVHRAYLAPRAGDNAPKNAERFTSFSALCAQCAKWLNSEGV